MLYRRTPQEPCRPLLKIAVAAGAGAILGVTACSDQDPQRVSGIIAFPHDAAADAPCGQGVIGSVDCGPPDAGAALPDAGDDGAAEGGDGE
jgi:hypothetical protein